MESKKINGNFVLINRIWLLILIGSWIFSMGVAYAVVKTQIEANTFSIEANSDYIIKNDNKISTTASNIQEIKFNIKSICKALKIEYIE